MKKLDPRDPQAVAAVLEIIARIAPEWKSGNVVDILPVVKTAKGFAQPDTLAIGFFVNHKLPADELDAQTLRAIPSEIEGVPTDVVSTHGHLHGSVDTKGTRSQLYDTLIGGIAVGNAEMNAYGTLGMICFAQSDGRAVALTNEHVLVFNNDGHPGDEVQQPRFYMTREVSLESAACCPNGQLRFRGTTNVVAATAAAVFAAAVIAAALSDEIDPHRRGEDATPVSPGERTFSETVSTRLDYPVIPFPGRPFSVGVKWRYTRKTNLREVAHDVGETQTNEHVLSEQYLTSDRPEYTRGARVRLTALLGIEPKNDSCDRYFVTAAALSPGGTKAHRIILHYRGRYDGHSAITHVDQHEGAVRCFTFVGEASRSFTGWRLVNGLTIRPSGVAAFIPLGSVPDAALQFPQKGVTIELPEAAEQVNVRGFAQTPVSLTARDGKDVVGQTVASPDATGAVQLRVSAKQITAVDISEGGKAPLITSICISRPLRSGCLYTGTFDLAGDEELGMWRTYLFAQTRNNVALGMKPEIAAQTIGGLPLTDNYAPGGTSYNITYGYGCLVDVVPNGAFRVVEPPIIG